VLAAAFSQQERSSPAPAHPPAADGPAPFSCLLLLYLLYSINFPRTRALLCWLTQICSCLVLAVTSSVLGSHSPSIPSSLSCCCCSEQLWKCLLYIFFCAQMVIKPSVDEGPACCSLLYDPETVLTLRLIPLPCSTINFQPSGTLLLSA